MIPDHGGDAVVQPPQSLRQVCAELRDRIDAFLAEEQRTPLLRQVQAQVRESTAVVDEALGRYRCVGHAACAAGELLHAHSLSGR